MKKVFWDNPYQCNLTTSVASVSGNRILFEETIAFSFSGGQESDKAYVNGMIITNSEIDGNLIYYTLPEVLFFTAAQNESIWTYNSAKAFGERFYSWFDKAIKCLQNQQHFPFIVRRISDAKIIGSTRYYDINREHHRLTIGYTWYIPEVWGSYINPECKLLLLKFAFEDLQVNRVEFVTDSRNSRSRAAIKKIGAVEEGVLRHHMILEDGFIRDSVMFSVVKSDWPQIKSLLQFRLKKLS